MTKLHSNIIEQEVSNLTQEETDFLITKYEQIRSENRVKTSKATPLLFFGTVAFYMFHFSVIENFKIGPIEISEIDLIYRVFPIYLAYYIGVLSSQASKNMTTNVILDLLYGKKYPGLQGTFILSKVSTLRRHAQKQLKEKKKPENCLWGCLIIIIMIVPIMTVVLLILGIMPLFITLAGHVIYISLDINNYDFIQILITIISCSLIITTAFILIKDMPKYWKLINGLTHDNKDE